MRLNRPAIAFTALTLATLLSGAALWRAQPPARAATTDAPQRTISVNGQAEVLATPDMATVSFGVLGRGATAQEAMNQASNGMNAVLSALRGAVIADNDIRTTGVSVSPEYGKDIPPSIVGYRASNSVQVKVRDLGKLPAVLDSSVAAGATYAGGIQFGFNNDSDLRTTAMQAAAKAARTKADALAQALGVTVTGVQSASDNGVSFPTPLGRGGAPDVAPGFVPTPIEPGQQSITGSVNAVFTIE